MVRLFIMPDLLFFIKKMLRWLTKIIINYRFFRLMAPFRMSFLINCHATCSSVARTECFPAFVIRATLVLSALEY